MLRRWRCRHQTGIGKPHAFHDVLAKPSTLNRIFRMPRVWRDAPWTKKVFRQHFRAWLVDWVCTLSTAAQRSTTTMTIPAQDRSDIALREAEIDNHRLTALILLFTHVFQPGPSATG